MGSDKHCFTDFFYNSQYKTRIFEIQNIYKKIFKDFCKNISEISAIVSPKFLLEIIPDFLSKILLVFLQQILQRFLQKIIQGFQCDSISFMISFQNYCIFFKNSSKNISRKFSTDLQMAPEILT